LCETDWKYHFEKKELSVQVKKPGQKQGRKAKSSMDVMRTRVWLAEMMRFTGCANLNQLGELIDDLDDKKMLYRYASGQNGISKKKLAEIDVRIKQRIPGRVDGSSVFLIGPKSERAAIDFVPLWDALGGTMEQVNEVLTALDPAIAIQKYLGVSFLIRSSYIVFPLFGELDPPAYWAEEGKANRIAERYSNNEFTVDVELITFAIAAWRMAYFIGDAIPMMNYVMVGLLERAIPETLDRLFRIELEKSPKAQAYTITQDFLDYLEELSRRDVDDADDAIKDLSYSVPGWPVERVVDDQTVFVVDEQIHDYRFLFLAVVHSSVCKYLELRKKRLLAPTVSITVPSP